MMDSEGRGLDHLMEQNDTELTFLSAYGGVGDAPKSDGAAILAALKRFLIAGGMKAKVEDQTLVFAAGNAIVMESGCLLTFEGQHLPLVESDLTASGFCDGVLSKKRNSVSVCLTAWNQEQRRLVERLVEHHMRG